MSYVDKINSVVDALDLGKPIFNVQLRGKNIRVNDQEWNPHFDMSNFVESSVKSNIYRYRMFDSNKKEYYVKKDDLVDSIISEHIDSIISIFTECSPYDQPRRTNIYKDFVEVVRGNKNNEKFRDAIFNIVEYYFNSTQTDSIRHPNNDVHRKNIYHLLCLMEKSYGKKTSNE